MKNAYQNQKIAVLGLGESGEAAAEYLAGEGAIVTVLDSADETMLGAKMERLRRRGIAVQAGCGAADHVNEFSFAVLSPGLDPAAALPQSFSRGGVEIIGELELAARACECPVIAITGTNGKTTTTELVARMLNACHVRTRACGNISPAFSRIVAESAGLDMATVEVSSFQLETIRLFCPHIAVWLNLAPDHLDRYASLDEYRTAKLRIFENQTPQDFAVVNLRDELPALAAKKITFSAHRAGGDLEFREGAIYFQGEKVLKLAATKLRGLHNAENLMAALGVGIALGLSFEKMTPPLCSYAALPHRCEVVGTHDGVEYVNDSKATNLDALEQALRSETRPMVLIAGGKDKGFEFDSISRLVGEKTRCAILIGEMSGRIAANWEERISCYRADSLADAVRLAQAQARPGDVVLFSPGTSSFDMFKNYADRGNQFRALVQTIQAQ